ncbi:glycerophosphodiester phosphodiesterase family protein [Thaumasiovibrio sp. DFM-14]|uniref:glycerophosphodiester phosphodiesterase family protein n=1 Tax=Thaumasiovibrio sp. DFM-14 TaxID=3384792 RepID=UPI0039A2F40E
MASRTLTLCVRICIVISLSWILFSYARFYFPASITTLPFPALRIAHAGGGLDQHTYTNSLQALKQNVSRGFMLFEIDFSFTRDGHLVCLHDWGKSFYDNFGFTPSRPLSLDEFQQVLPKGHHTNCTLKSLSDWLQQHPHIRIVTDIKENNQQALALINQAIPDASQRVIPQIYHPEQFEPVKALGFKRIIWTLYRFHGNTRQIRYWLGRFHGSIAITMPKHRAQQGLGVTLAQHKITTFVHTVNSPRELDILKSKYQISEIYTDHLVPQPLNDVIDVSN